MASKKPRRRGSPPGARTAGTRGAATGSRTRTKTTRARKASKVLANLSPEQGRAALLAFAARHPEFTAEIERIVTAAIGSTSFEDVPAEVVAAIELLDVTEVWANSGRQESGYVDPAEAATDMVVEAIEPFVEEVRRLVGMGLGSAALATCRGVLLGLYLAEQDRVTEVLDWLPDGLGDFVQHPIRALAGNRPLVAGSLRPLVPRELRQFVREHLPKWKWLQR